LKTHQLPEAATLGIAVLRIPLPSIVDGPFRGRLRGLPVAVHLAALDHIPEHLFSVVVILLRFGQKRLQVGEGSSQLGNQVKDPAGERRLV